MITLKLSRDDVTPDLRRLLKEASTNGPLQNVLGRAGANVLKKHFRARNRTPNKLGGTRTNFWSAVAASVQSPRQTPGKIVIPINHPAIAQKVFGGTITPKKANNLSIPVNPAAHGKSPRVFPGLRFAMNAAGLKMLFLYEDGDFNLMYVLKRSVTQDKDANALPPEREMVAALTKAGDIYLRNR